MTAAVTERQSSDEHARAGPVDLWTLERDAWAVDCMTPEEAATQRPALPTRRHRRASVSLRLFAYAAMAVALFLGGWWTRGVLQGGPSTVSDPLAAVLLPEKGVTLDARWGDLPRRLAQSGVIDVEKFKEAAERAGSPLTAAQLRMLTERSDEVLHIDASNAYFVLDLLWALGLANDNPILTRGPMAQRGSDQAGRYASTGGWTIGAKPGPQYLAALKLIRLTPQQQAIAEEVAFNSYRPCCGNMTAFPDCNHGMAALGLAELMASQGASADQVFWALKEVSPFWFPAQYHHLALYFEGQEQRWDEVDPRLVMGQDHSSAAGWREVDAWLQQEGVLTGTGPGGGKTSGCAP